MLKVRKDVFMRAVFPDDVVKVAIEFPDDVGTISTGASISLSLPDSYY